MASQLLLVSYAPLLRTAPGQLLDPSCSSELFTALDQLPSGAADACLWLESVGRPYPVLVINHAEAIADHLIKWAEGDPGRGSGSRLPSAVGATRSRCSPT